MIAVLGAHGQLGSAFMRILGDSAQPVTRSQLDLTDLSTIESWARRERPETIINCAAYTAVDNAEEDEGTARAVNTQAVGRLAEVGAEGDIRLVTFSTDFVFDGAKPRGYVESDEPNPLNVYGRSKADGEALALEAHPGCLVVRTSWVLSGTHRNFASTMIDLASEGQVMVVDDQRGRPTITDDLASAVLEAIEMDTTGLLHLTNRGQVTRYHLAREIAGFAGLDVKRITPVKSNQHQRLARRPANSVLDSERLEELALTPLPHYLGSLERIVQQIMDRRSRA